MANHQSAIKRNKQAEIKKVHNKYYTRTTRNAIKALRGTTEKSAAADLYPKVVSMLDRMAKHNRIHKNKAANLKSKLARFVNSL
jgi:small subunit ribosomal protein S20